MNLHVLYKLIVYFIQNYSFFKKNLFVIGIEDFGNLGDHQIGLSEVEYLKDTYPNRNIVVVAASEYFIIRHVLPFLLKHDTVVFLTGGGNMGSDYLFAEKIKRDVVERFNRNKVVVFPQSVYYRDSQELQISKTIYENHPDFFICTRDERSFNIVKSIFNVKVVLVPDIVLYSNRQDKTIPRENKALLCLRNDLEQTLSHADHDYIINVVKKTFGSYEITDTQLDHELRLEDGKTELVKCFRQIQTSKIVITDRLHGMIFSAISGTPCVVFSNYNHKISGAYKWIENLGYIKFLDTDLSKLGDTLKLLMNHKFNNYDTNKMRRNFKPLNEILCH